MKKILIMCTLCSALFAEQMCSVTMCNRIERFSLNPLAHMSDKYNETCFDSYMPKNQVYVGAIISSDSRWYQGNPTKKSVTKITKVNFCQ